MTATYENIATTTLGSDQNSVTFSSISASFTDLVIVCSVSAASGSGTVGLQFNSDTGSNYSGTRLYGDGSTAASDRGTNNTLTQIGFVTTAICTNIFQVMNYANTTTNKTALGRGNASDSAVLANVGLWRSTAAINSVTILRPSGNFLSGSTFTLYGIKAE
jgi:hypothetical protein